MLRKEGKTKVIHTLHYIVDGIAQSIDRFVHTYYARFSIIKFIN